MMRATRHGFLTSLQSATLLGGLALGACSSDGMNIQAIGICEQWYRTERWGSEIPARTLLEECQVQSSEVDKWAAREATPTGGYPARARIELHKIHVTEGYALLRLERWPEAELAFNDAIEMTTPVELPGLPGAENKRRWNGVALYGRAVARERQGKLAAARIDFAEATSTDMLLTPELRRKLEDKFGRYRTR